MTKTTAETLSPVAIRFIVDSTFCVTKEYAKKHDIKIVDLKLILDGQETNEGFPDEWGDFYQRFKTSKNFPTTSQANPQEYEEAIAKILRKEPNAQIIVLTVAGTLSGTINSAKQGAEKFKDKNVTVIDSNSVSICSLMMLEEMVKLSESGGSLEEVIALCENLKTKLAVQFIPDTMEYLKRGGRVGKLSAILASIASIKPVFDFRNNKVTVPAKTLGIGRGASAMIKRLPGKYRKIYVCYIHDDKNVQMLVEKVRTALGIQKPEIFAINPIFGVHIGIGAIGIACME